MTGPDGERALQGNEEQTERWLQSLQGAVSKLGHDLRSPVITIESMTGILVDRLKNRLEGSEAQFLEHMLKAARTIRVLLEGLTQYLAVGRCEIDLEEIDLGRILADARVMRLREASMRGGRIEIVSQDWPTLRANRQGIELMVAHLLDNALHFVDPEKAPRVEVRGTWEGEGSFVLSVSDNGSGVPEECRETVFLPYTCMHRSPGPDGAGMGLAIVRCVAENHGGSAWVEPGQEGGSVFHVRLEINRDRHQ